MTVVDPPRFVRADGPDKVTGSGRYTADLTLTGMLHAKFLYAGVPHARITTLDTSAAVAMPGVFAVLTADDVPDVIYSPVVPDRRLFAKDVVRFEGELLAAAGQRRGQGAPGGLIVVEIDQRLVVVVDDEGSRDRSFTRLGRVLGREAQAHLVLLLRQVEGRVPEEGHVDPVLRCALAHDRQLGGRVGRDRPLPALGRARQR